MTKLSQPIVFFGTEDFSLITLKALVEADFPVVAVVTKPDSPQGRGHTLTAPAVKTYAATHNIAVLQPQKLSEIADEIRRFANPVGVLVSYGKIIPQSIIDLFTPGIINLHPSLLPTYRGPSPIESAILHGDHETGVSIMQLSAAMDAGPVYSQMVYPLAGDETTDYLYAELGFLGTKLLIELLPVILDGSQLPTPQQDQYATYCKLIKKTDGIIDWTKPAEQIEREIRAYAGWPQSRTRFGDLDVIITGASVIPTPTHTAPGTHEIVYNETVKTLFVTTGSGQLEIDSLKPLGKKEMPITAFLAGYKDRIT